MKTYSYTQARQNLSELLNFAENETVEIRRRDGRVFRVVSAVSVAQRSPLDVPGAVETGRVNSGISVAAVRDSREHR